MADKWTTIDGYRVQFTTDKAVLIKKGATEVWVPRSCVQDHDALAVGDTDLTVASWFVAREGLDS